ncbi:ribosomal protein L1 [Acrodontium crateriforme]|uniref:Ribosomal protein L1 n=1 Tax=Acrodontium crateriforme TaxID=150365 RepID=A0AAQ3R762_9PEZI|nr:ribosomal protein L1 [Acrodontium crateriforme]
MAPQSTALATTASSPLDSQQTLRATTALLKKLQSEEVSKKDTAEKSDLLADADEDEVADSIPVWLVLSTKKHIIDKQRLKPGKIVLPNPYLDANDETLRICLITADPQRKYKDLIADESFPLELGKRVSRVVGITKLKAKYKSFEARRQLFDEYDVFLADDRIITYLPTVLGKVFYKSGSKRPIPVTLEGKRQSIDEKGNKRRKLAEGGSKVTKSDVKPSDIAQQIERTLSSTLVHLAPSTTTAVKVGTQSMEPKQLQENIEHVTNSLVEKYVPQKWQNVRSVHIKGPNTVALPIWMTTELWEDEKDVLDEPLPVKQSKKRKRGGLADVIEVPGPDGVMRKLEKPGSDKKSKTDDAETIEAKAAEKEEKAARKQALKDQKDAAKKAVNGAAKTEEKKSTRKTRMKAADLI